MAELKAKIKEILQGWKNHLIKPTPSVNILADTRMQICKRCVLNIGNFCSKNKEAYALTKFMYNGETRSPGIKYKGCGCYLPAKTKSPTSSCPLGKW